jgi:hypothetical protein
MGEIIMWIGRVVAAPPVHPLSWISSSSTIAAGNTVIIRILKEINGVGKTSNAVPKEKDMMLLSFYGTAAAAAAPGAVVARRHHHLDSTFVS